MPAPDDATVFVQREYPRLVAAVYMLTNDHQVAEELAQEALERAFARWERISLLESPGGWTHRVAVNLATSTLRRRSAERRAKARHGEPQMSHEPDTASDLAVRQALGRLKPAQQRLLVLMDVLGWTATELATLEGCTSATIRQRLHRARKALRAHLAATTPDEELADV